VVGQTSTTTVPDSNLEPGDGVPALTCTVKNGRGVVLYRKRCDKYRKC